MDGFGGNSGRHWGYLESRAIGVAYVADYRMGTSPSLFINRASSLSMEAVHLF